MTGLTAKRFRTRNKRLSVVDETRQSQAALDAWSLWLSAVALCRECSDLDLKGQAAIHMRATVDALTSRLARMK